MKLIYQMFLWTLATTFCFQTHAQIYDTNGEVVETFVGSQFHGYYDGQGTQTMFYNPSRIVADTSGNLFVLDNGNYRIRMVTPGGTVSTFAGGGTTTGSTVSGIGTNLNLGSLTFNSITIDHSNALWITTVGNLFLLRIGSDSLVSQIHLTNELYPPSSCSGLCVDSENNIYISDSTGNRIYRYDTNGVLEVFAGSGDPGTVDGNGLFTSFLNPAALAADAADNIYVYQPQYPSGQPAKIRRINQSADVVTIAGGLVLEYGSNYYPKYGDGVGTNAALYDNFDVTQMCADGSGNIILASGSSIRMMTATTNVITLAGQSPYNNFLSTALGYSNGPGSNALFNAASGVCFSQGSVFVADTQNQRIREITYNAAPQIVPPASLQLSTYPALQITGTVGRTYQIQTSTNMNAWNTVATVLLTSSPYLWPDQNAVIGKKFYRAVLLP